MPHSLSHSAVWAAIDALAQRHGLSASGLARAAGLDPTTFNKSKRVTASGRPRWPSTESLAKIFEATGATLDDFSALVGGDRTPPGATSTIPVIGLAQAGDGGFFDDAGFPVGGGWEQVVLPDVGDANAYALEISGDSMLPLYRQGDKIIVSPAATIRRGDRVVVKTRGGEILAKQLARQTAQTVELSSLNPDYEDRTLALSDVVFMARIIWASQ
ncbi:MAG: helix-turn-helix transcriptional regulator [Rhodobiaceae bacterium]|nr:helix-turn-helix transcriptional regulator [Rhodobiaceae bacterium]